VVSFVNTGIKHYCQMILSSSINLVFYNYKKCRRTYSYFFYVFLKMMYNYKFIFVVENVFFFFISHVKWSSVGFFLQYGFSTFFLSIIDWNFSLFNVWHIFLRYYANIYKPGANDWCKKLLIYTGQAKCFRHSKVFISRRRRHV